MVANRSPPDSYSGAAATSIGLTEDLGRTVPLARAIVVAKISKQVVVLQRLSRRDHAETTRRAIESIRRITQTAADRD